VRSTTFCTAIRTEALLAMRGDDLYLRRQLVAVLGLLSCLIGAAAGQASAPPLEVLTTTLPNANLRKSYEARIEAQGGVAPLKWELTEGSLPEGLVFSRDGVISGIPTTAGEFHFTVTVRDSGTPAYQRQQNLTLIVVAPLLAEWGRYPKVSGQRLEGSVLVSNQTKNDFDLTVIVLAVNEIGRATAIGYQHFALKKNSDRIEIPFGDNLPRGRYQLNVDAVAEVPATDSIYRARLVPKEKFEVKVGP